VIKQNDRSSPRPTKAGEYGSLFKAGTTSGMRQHCMLNRFRLRPLDFGGKPLCHRSAFASFAWPASQLGIHVPIFALDASTVVIR
jgi:hypothetical protein